MINATQRQQMLRSLLVDTNPYIATCEFLAIKSIPPSSLRVHSDAFHMSVDACHVVMSNSAIISSAIEVIPGVPESSPFLPDPENRTTQALGPEITIVRRPFRPSLA
jgi:hypothetical protein